MPLPSGLSTFEISFGPYLDLEGNVAFGGVQGKLSVSPPIVDSTSGALIFKSVDFYVDNDGTATVGPLVANDDLRINQGTQYTVEWQVRSSLPSPPNKTFVVPVASGASVDYDLLASATGTVAGPYVLPLVTSVAGRSGAVTLTKSDVGLGSVDNTADADKPVSTAQAAALAAKAVIADIGTPGTATGDALRAAYGLKAGPNTWSGTQDFTGATVTGISGGTGTAAATTASAEFGMGVARSPQASTGTFRVFQLGTSIATFDNSPNAVFAQRLKDVYGDCGESVVLAGGLGGSYDVAYNGWKKQPYGGQLFVRARGESTSTAIVETGYFDTLTLEVSKDTGGGTCTVLIDGVQVGTLDSTGSQLYGVQSVFTTTLGAHTVTVNPPASGYVYLEQIRMRDSTRHGVETINAALGGSSISSMTILRTPLGAQIAGIAISGNAGLDAYFGRTDVDLIVCSDLVNDAGSAQTVADWQTSVDYAVSKARATNTPLIWLVEPAGHYADAADNPGQSARYTQMRSYLLGLPAQSGNGHVAVIDWHAMIITPDLTTYRTRYYDATGTTGAYVGDFIHPHTLGMRPATAAMCELFGITPPTYDLVSTAQAQRQRATAPAATATITTVGGLTRSYPVAEGVALKATGGSSPRRVSYYRDNAVINYAKTVADAIAASGTSDAYGKYVTYSNLTIGIAPAFDFTAGERLTVTARARGTFTFATNTTGTSIYVDGVALPYSGTQQFQVVLDSAIPSVVTVEFGSPTNNPNITINGTFYEFCATRSTVPILTTKPTVSLREIGTPALLTGDPAYDDAMLGSLYYEILLDGTTLVEKSLIGRCNKWLTASQTASDVGLYQAPDRTAAGRVLARIAGTKTAVADGYMGNGYSETTTASPKEWQVSGLVNLSAAARYTVAFRMPASMSSVQIALYSGGTNTWAYMGPDGTFGASAVNVRSSVPASLTGRMLAFTFDGPTAQTATLGTTPLLRVQANGASQFGTLVGVKGALACA